MPENYRGITLTSITSKLLERLVHMKVSEFLRSGSALSDFQYGFREGYSCSDFLLNVIDDWPLARDKVSVPQSSSSLFSSFVTVYKWQELPVRGTKL